MRVVHYHPSMLAVGSGPATAARGWASASASIGVPTLAVVDRDAARPFAVDGAGVVAIAHRGRGRARIPVGLADVLEDDDVLVLHGGWLVRNAIAGFTANRRRIPYVVNAHAVYDPHVFDEGAVAKEAWAATMERRMLRRALAVHLFFDEERAGLARLGVHVRTIIAPNGADPAERHWDGGSGGYVLWMGRYAPRHKGLDLLIRALHRLPAADRPLLRLHGPDWRGQKGVVRSNVERLGLAPWVTVGDEVHGHAKWELISRAVGCAYPSRWEGCSMSVLEAISAGVPTLVTPYAMGRSLAADGAAVGTGWSIDDIAAGLSRLISPDAASVGERAAEVARTRLTWDAVARSWLAQVESLGSRAHATGASA